MYAAKKAAEARAAGNEARAEYWDSVARKVDEAPPFDSALRARLAVLLRPAAGPTPLPIPKQGRREVEPSRTEVRLP